MIVKQALPYLRIVGDAWLLPLRRSFFEYQALSEEARQVPHLVPKPYHFDEPAAAMDKLAIMVLNGQKVTDGMDLGLPSYEKIRLINDKIIYGNGWIDCTKDF